MPFPIEAVLFDLGRVVVDIDMTRIHRRWAEHAGLPAGHFDQAHTAAVMRHEIFHRHERGEISDAEFFAHMRGLLGLDLTDGQMLDGWNSIFIGEMAGIRGVLAQLAGKKPMYVFSNTNAAHQAHWTVHFADLLAPFTKVYVSNELGHRKPEPEAFRAVVADMKVPAERVLFFDDSAVNVAGAKACGLHAVQVTSTADILTALDQFAI